MAYMWDIGGLYVAYTLFYLLLYYCDQKGFTTRNLGG